MNHLHLSSDFNYLNNRSTDRGYVVAKNGAVSVVNSDAMDLLTGADRSWLSDPDYTPFVDRAVGAGWLVDAPAPRAPSVRSIERRIHLRRVQYEVNLFCNLECAHCYCLASPSASQGLSTEFAKDLIRQAAELGALHFDITGGEPMLRKDIFELVEEIVRQGMIPSIFTNATTITAEKAARLKELGLAAVQTSLDARSPELHDEFRGSKGAFERTVRGIRELKAAGIGVSVTTCLNKRNAHELPAIVKFLKEDLAVPYRLDRVINAGRGLEHDSPIALTNDEFYLLLRSLLRERPDAVTKKVCDAVNLAATEVIEPGCGVGAWYMFIKHDGRAAICPTMTEAESTAFAQADLKAMSLAEAWESHPTFNLFRGVQCENTAVCPTGKSCRGGCRSNAYLIEGRVDAPDELHCNLQKNGGDDYVPFIAEYERRRAVGELPSRPAVARFSAARRLRVIG